MKDKSNARSYIKTMELEEVLGKAEKWFDFMQKLKQQKPFQCMTPDCGHNATHRGHCGHHYRRIRKIVETGVVSWSWLQNMGKVAVRKKDQATKNEFMNWLFGK